MVRRILWVVLVGSIVGAGLAAAEEVARDAHFVEADDWFVGRDALEGRARVVVEVFKMETAAPSDDAEATFIRDRNPPVRESRFYWRSREAKPAELKPGALVIVCTTAPSSREDAVNMSWDLTRVVSGEENGTVLVLGAVKAKQGCMRIVEGAPGHLEIAVKSRRDQHHLHAEDWLVWSSDEPPPTDPKQPLELEPAMAIKPPVKAGDVGDFLVIRSGKRVKTAFALRTRVAKAEDLAVGTRAAIPTHSASKEGPPSRAEAVSYPWLVGPITKTGRVVNVDPHRSTDPAAVRIVIDK